MDNSNTSELSLLGCVFYISSCHFILNLIFKLKVKSLREKIIYYK